MSVEDLLDLMIDNGETIEIFDDKVGEVVFSGSVDEVKDTDYVYEEVSSFDIRPSKDSQYMAILCINISTEE